MEERTSNLEDRILEILQRDEERELKDMKNFSKKYPTQLGNAT